MNLYAVSAIYRIEMARTQRTWLQSIVSPVISTSLYFVVFGAAIGSRISTIEGVSYGAFIVPGLMMLILARSRRCPNVTNASACASRPNATFTCPEAGQNATESASAKVDRLGYSTRRAACKK